MSIGLAILLGLVQGLAEFIPISSSGHLLLVQYIFGVNVDLLAFYVVLHIATLFAVLLVFRKKVWQLICNPFCRTNYCLLVATIITCAMALVFNDWIDNVMTYRVLPITFMITAIVLFCISFVENKSGDTGEVQYKTGFAAGLAQGIALIPGISRSGATISASLATGENRERAAEFAFLMSIPIIIASCVHQVAFNPSGFGAVSALPLIAGFVTAFVSGVFAIKFMLHVIKRVKLYWFSAYLVALSIVLSFVFFW
jgi:undecaprenyl-diphosphatase